MAIPGLVAQLVRAGVYTLIRVRSEVQIFPTRAQLYSLCVRHGSAEKKRGPGAGYFSVKSAGIFMG